MPDRVPVCLSIAGSDSGGGAGIQADLKAFAHAGVHGTTALTALTAQNTTAVTGVHPVPPGVHRRAGARGRERDLGMDAVKIGMVGSARATEAVAWALDELPRGTPVVPRPVMVAESGARLLEADAEDALRDLLLPRRNVATPNLMEARVLVRDATLDGEELARRVHELGPDVVIVTGGPSRRGRGPVLRRRVVRRDCPARGTRMGRPMAPAARTLDARGQLALGAAPLDAARIAREVAAEAVRRGLRELGGGAGPVDVLGVSDRLRTRSALP
jgi:hydroxymethylpyrimidine/phosphomethylpyrimidine kinase